MTGIALIGSGYMAREAAWALSDLPDVRVPVVFNHREPGARELAAGLGAEWTTALAAAVDRPDVDGVVIATANDAHLEPALMAARCGKHIFVEKPMALSVDDCHRMVAAARAAGVFILVGLSLRFTAGVRAMADMVPAVIGRPLAGRALRTVWSGLDGAGSWKLQSDRSGGDLFHHLHELDLLIRLLGEPAEVYARLENLAHPHLPEYYDASFLTIGFVNGAVAHVESGTAWRWPEHQMVISGDQGAVQLDMRRSVVSTLHLSGERTEIPLFSDPAANLALAGYYAAGVQQGSRVYGTAAQRPPLYLQHLMLTEMRHFVACIRGEEQPLVDGQQGTRSVALAEAARRSAELRRPVELTATREKPSKE